MIGLLGAGVLAVAATSASAVSILDYNVGTRGSFSSSNTEVNGALAAGGSVTLANFSVGVGLPSGYSGAALLAGGDLTYSNGTVFQGDVVAGGSITRSGLAVPNGTVSSHTAGPLDFAAEFSNLAAISAGFAGMAGNGTVTGGGSYVFTGTDNALNIFSISAADLAASNGFTVNIPDGSVAVFNVSGSSFVSNYPGSFVLNGQTISNGTAGLASALLFNFTDAGSAAFNGSWAGTVLAPEATVSLANGGFFGSLYADTVSSSSEFYQAGFSGYGLENPPPPPVSGVPEPATWALLIAGFGLVGLAARRRTRPARGSLLS